MKNIEQYNAYLGKTYRRKGTQNKYKVEHIHESKDVIYITMRPFADNSDHSSSDITETMGTFLNAYTDIYL